MNDFNKLQKFHIYLWFNQTTEEQKKKLRDYYVGVITSDETDKISTMTYHELYRVVKYDGFERPISDFDFEELLIEYINRGLQDSNLEKNVATMFSSIEYMQILEEYAEWINRNKIPPLPNIDKQVEILLPNLSTLVISKTNRLDYYSIFVSSMSIVDSSLIKKILDRLLQEIGQGEVTLVQLESIYHTLFYI